MPIPQPNYFINKGYKPKGKKTCECCGKIIILYLYASEDTLDILRPMYSQVSIQVSIVPHSHNYNNRKVYL